jgi:hypothetical protein
MIRDKHRPSIDTLRKLKNAGMSIDWLLDEDVSMYANNREGKRLKQLNTCDDDPNKLRIIGRIKLWITSNFGSLRQFSEYLNYNYDDLLKIILEGYIPGSTLITTLKTLGCNTEWIFTGEGEPSNNNQITFPMPFSKNEKKQKELFFKS